ncbi:hypothetical protein B0H21DRAFT_708025 [Amylocystis lapponica]|nr:hypothetical protein B0H21DRAFT_708025 [Amylocystis lapponica]
MAGSRKKTKSALSSSVQLRTPGGIGARSKITTYHQINSRVRKAKAIQERREQITGMSFDERQVLMDMNEDYGGGDASGWKRKDNRTRHDRTHVRNIEWLEQRAQLVTAYMEWKAGASIVAADAPPWEIGSYDDVQQRPWRNPVQRDARPSWLSRHSPRPPTVAIAFRVLESYRQHHRYAHDSAFRRKYARFVIFMERSSEDSRTGRSNAWLTPAYVDRFKDDVLRSDKVPKIDPAYRRVLPQRLPPLIVTLRPTTTTSTSLEHPMPQRRAMSPCRFVLNAGATRTRSTQKMFALFAVTGIFVCLCRHGHLLVICDMIRSGNCVVPAFHGHSHNRGCQVNWHPMYMEGVGKEDFEVVNGASPNQMPSPPRHDSHPRFTSSSDRATLRVLGSAQAWESDDTRVLNVLSRELKIGPDDYERWTTWKLSCASKTPVDRRGLRRIEEELNIPERWVPGSPQYEPWCELGHENTVVHSTISSDWLCNVFSSLRSSNQRNWYVFSYMCITWHSHDVGYKMREKIGKALKSRAEAVKKALVEYNRQATELVPHVHVDVVGEFDLLRDAQQDIRELPWAQRANRQAMSTYFNVQRAKEEING